MMPVMISRNKVTFIIHFLNTNHSNLCFMPWSTLVKVVYIYIFIHIIYIKYIYIYFCVLKCCRNVDDKNFDKVKILDL